MPPDGMIARSGETPVLTHWVANLVVAGTDVCDAEFSRVGLLQPGRGDVQDCDKIGARRTHLSLDNAFEFGNQLVVLAVLLVDLAVHGGSCCARSRGAKGDACAHVRTSRGGFRPGMLLLRLGVVL